MDILSASALVVSRLFVERPELSPSHVEVVWAHALVAAPGLVVVGWSAIGGDVFHMPASVAVDA